MTSIFFLWNLYRKYARFIDKEDDQMKTKTPRKYVSLNMPEELKNWYDEHSDRLGLSTTALMVMALTQVREGTEKAKAHLQATGVLPKVEDLVSNDEDWQPDVLGKIREMKK